MDCEKDTFSIFYNNRHINVETICEGKTIQFCVHLPEEDVIVEMYWDEEREMEQWHELGKGRTERANQIGQLIECCPDHK